MLRVYNNTARYVDQGGNKRPGAFAIYLEPWHADVYDFLDCRKNTGMYGAVTCKVFKIISSNIIPVLLNTFLHRCGFFCEKKFNY